MTVANQCLSRPPSSRITMSTEAAASAQPTRGDFEEDDLRRQDTEDDNKIRVQENPTHHLQPVMNATPEVILAVGAPRATPPLGSLLAQTGARRIARRRRRTNKKDSTLEAGNLRKFPGHKGGKGGHKSGKKGGGKGSGKGCKGKGKKGKSTTTTSLALSSLAAASPGGETDHVVVGASPGGETEVVSEGAEVLAPGCPIQAGPAASLRAVRRNSQRCQTPPLRSIKRLCEAVAANDLSSLPRSAAGAGLAWPASVSYRRGLPVWGWIPPTRLVPR